MPANKDNIQATRSALSRSIKRGKKKRAGRATMPRLKLLPNDPLLNLGTFAVAGPGGKMCNSKIDRVLYGGPVR